MRYRSVMVSSRSFHLLWAAGGWGSFWDRYFLWFGVLKPCLGRDVHFTALVCRRCEITHAWEQACARGTLAWPTARAYVALKAVGFQEIPIVFLNWFFWRWTQLPTLRMTLNRSFGSLALAVGLQRWDLCFCPFPMHCSMYREWRWQQVRFCKSQTLSWDVEVYAKWNV